MLDALARQVQEQVQPALLEVRRRIPRDDKMNLANARQTDLALALGVIGVGNKNNVLAGLGLVLFKFEWAAANGRLGELANVRSPLKRLR